MNTRDLWRPQRKELPQQCASCPFRPGGKFADIVKKLCGIAGERFSKAKVVSARIQLMIEVESCGDFICHGTAYNADMSMRKPSEFRQCPGATAWFKKNCPRP